jgi:hypothetical protein
VIIDSIEIGRARMLLSLGSPLNRLRRGPPLSLFFFRHSQAERVIKKFNTLL